MSKEKVYEYFEKNNLKDRIYKFNDSSATVELAAQKLGCEPMRIAKTLAFIVNNKPVLIVAAGDAKVDNAKFRNKFSEKATMIQRELLNELVGHEAGGVCPFCVKENVKVYLDKSLLRFETVYPACGDSNNAIKLTISELETYSNYIEWIDVCRGWN